MFRRMQMGSIFEDIDNHRSIIYNLFWLAKGNTDNDQIGCPHGRKIMKSKQRLLFGCYAMVLAIIGDYLLGYGTIGTSSDPDAYMGISWNVAPDWRYLTDSDHLARIMKMRN